MALVSYADVPFLLDSDEVNEWIEKVISLDDMRVTVPERIYPGPGLLGISYPFRYPHRPKLRVGQAFYPVGASRWFEYVGLISSDQFQVMFDAAYDDAAGVIANDFVMNDGTDPDPTKSSILVSNCFLLPPRPLASFRDNLYLCTVVDERYYFQFKNAGVLSVTPSTTWDSLYASLATALGITLTHDAIPSAYGQPEPDSDLASNYENAAILLDAVAWNCGQSIVRQFDGTYNAYDTASSNGIIDANLTPPAPWLGGGNALT